MKKNIYVLAVLCLSIALIQGCKNDDKQKDAAGDSAVKTNTEQTSDDAGCPDESKIEGIVAQTTVNTAAGLKMRDKPGLSGKVLTVIPDKTEVKLLAWGEKEEKIAGKEGSWVKISWKGKTGWAFDAFLNIETP